MTMTWASFETALEGHCDVAGALNALTTSYGAEFQAMLDSIGAGEAGSLLAEAREADSVERRSKLAASLAIIDRSVPVSDHVPRQRLFGRRRVPKALASRSGDMVRSALVATLIDSELGGDPEESLRTRIAIAAAGWESALASDLSGASKTEREDETMASRRVLQQVLQFLLSDMKSRRAG